ncbi:sulfotransferase family protein [Litorilituus lipolyticus]|uniref:sulfotransferase family protein n=1 Tax=Litorilituus lipolyticus TaxID=2491017 RepID=UPI001478C9EF|nr:sulfotransferase [Litorilituus lipolyticus]
MTLSSPNTSPVFDRPVFILACPRSGSTLFYETLAKAKGLWTVGGESHAIIEEIPEFSTIYNGSVSNSLTELHGNDRSIALLKSRFAQQLRDINNTPYNYEQCGAIRFLEKTPKNALRIRFFKKVFPDALFIHLVRDPRDNISSIIDGWNSGHFITYPHLPGFNNRWSYLLPDNWQSLQEKPVEQIATFQWQAANQAIVDDLQSVADKQKFTVHYQDFLDNTADIIEQLCQFIGIEFDSGLQQYCQTPLPYSRYTLTKPEKNKWHKNKTLLEPNMPKLTTLVAQLNNNLQPFTDYRVNNSL